MPSGAASSVAVPPEIVPETVLVAAEITVMLPDRVLPTHTWSRPGTPEQVRAGGCGLEGVEHLEQVVLVVVGLLADLPARRRLGGRNSAEKAAAAVAPAAVTYADQP
jgi:hypothetical protein